MSALDALALVLSAPLVLSSRILHSSFFRSPVSSLSRVSPSRLPCPFCDPSGRGSSRFLAQERIPYDGDPRVSSGAPTENWKRPIGPRGHDKKVRAARHQNRPAKYADPSWIHAGAAVLDLVRYLCTSIPCRPREPLDPPSPAIRA